MTSPSLVGMVLATRYKILENAGVDSFKAHDLALDQTVKVRQASLASSRAGETLRRKLRQLALMRDPHFLNVLDVISDNSSEFVITEHPRGHSLGDLLRGRPRLGVEDVLGLLAPLAGALDRVAALSCCPSAISTCWLFIETSNSLALDAEERSLPDWPQFLVKLDVWELVRPMGNNNRLFLAAKVQRGSRGLAVRQAALLTYELLGGEKDEEDHLTRWFQPVNGLGKVGNSIVYRGLRYSSLFESSRCFFQELKAAIPSVAEGSGPAPALWANQENSVFSPNTNDVIRKFDRDTRWLATAVLGAVVFASLMLALPIQEHYRNSVLQTGEAVRAGGNPLLPTDVSTLAKNLVLTGKSSTDEMAPGQASSVDSAFAKISRQENPSFRMEAAGSTAPYVLAFNRSWIAAHGQDPDRRIGLKPHAGSKSSMRLRIVNVKMRLIALWHQSLMRSGRSGSWALFSNLKKGNGKKFSYTTQTNH